MEKVSEHSQESTQKIRTGNKGSFQKGHKFGNRFKKGYTPYNKGKKVKPCLEDTKKKISLAQKGKVNKGSFKKGHKFGNRFKKGYIPHNWKGGILTLYRKIRCLFEYRQWRSDVFQRDEFTCTKCFKKEDLHAHHIKSFAKIVSEHSVKSSEDATKCDELWNINNGITLCEGCHVAEHKKTNRDGRAVNGAGSRETGEADTFVNSRKAAGKG